MGEARRRSGGEGRWHALWGALLLGGLLALVMAGQAWAHAELRKADPAVGALYRWSRPTEVRLSFSQKLEPTSSSIVVLRRTFQTVQLGATQVDPDDPWTMAVALPALDGGTYTVNWHAKSIDGHDLAGSYSFTVLPREPIVTMIVAGVVLTGMGALVFARRARPGDPPGE